jgi:hypothetical protein
MPSRQYGSLPDRWAYEAMPWIGSELLWRSFALAMELRVLDMQASPYDLVKLGLAPVRVETEEGRVEYRRRQAQLHQVIRTGLHVEHPQLRPGAL